MTVRICVRARGPLAIEGEVELYDGEGNRIDLAGRARVLLCRCGASRSRPWCDGSHHRVAFEAPPPDDDVDSPRDDAAPAK